MSMQRKKEIEVEIAKLREELREIERVETNDGALRSEIAHYLLALGFHEDVDGNYEYITNDAKVVYFVSIEDCLIEISECGGDETFYSKEFYTLTSLRHAVYTIPKVYHIELTRVENFYCLDKGLFGDDEDTTVKIIKEYRF